MKSKRFGVIGGGQLAMMLCDAAKDMGHHVTVLAETSGEPALKHADQGIIGSFSDEASFERLFKGKDVIAFESEFSNGPALQRVAARHPYIKGFHISALNRVADKLEQKLLLSECKIPTAPYSVLQGDPRLWLKTLQNQFPIGCMIKWAKGGYDGKGNFLWHPQDSDIISAADFVTKAVELGHGVYAEELVQFEKELAVVTARSPNGEMGCYPTILTTQRNGICVSAEGPATQYGVSEKASNEAQAIAQRIGDYIGICGVYAVEFFYTAQGEVLVNEIAPRVHNSGHFTLGAGKDSQFKMHWLSLMGDPLGTFECAPFFGMLNILGPDGFKGRSTPLIHLEDGIISYWYEKIESRPGRKIGHIAVYGANQEIFQKRWQSAQQVLKDWHQIHSA